LKMSRTYTIDLGAQDSKPSDSTLPKGELLYLKEVIKRKVIKAD